MSDHESGLSSSPRRVLVVDDDDAVRAEIVAVLREAGYMVREAAGALSAMRSVLADKLDVVVLDLVLPDGHGIDVARAFRAITTSRDVCVVAITSHSASLEFVDPRTFGAASILIKPIAANDLLDAVDSCFGDEDWTGEYELPETRLSS
ncbi:MAG TPA: response regulator [Gemmatimonadaceae bacterium]|jgi:DNA-binding response OmpR family regulator